MIAGEYRGAVGILTSLDSEFTGKHGLSNEESNYTGKLIEVDNDTLIIQDPKRRRWVTESGEEAHIIAMEIDIHGSGSKNGCEVGPDCQARPSS